MFFRTDSRTNWQTKEQYISYRLVESFRDVIGDTRHRTVLTVGRLDDIEPQQLWAIADGLNARYRGEQSLFHEDQVVENHIDSIWKRLISEKKIDIVRDIQHKESTKDWQTIDTQSLNNKDITEVGAEWMCLQTLEKLGFNDFLEKNKFSENERRLALSHIVSRAVYPASELKTVSIMKENSSICELTGLDTKTLTKDQLYKICHKLYSIKNPLEKYLSKKTNELFDLQDKIILYDLTNTYFEGRMLGNPKAKRGRSKEKRSDCPLIVLALVVNIEGFIKYSTIFEGNRSDSTTIVEIIDKLRMATSETQTSKNKAIVVIDAGIATEENLALIVAKGYDYVCVSRSNLKKYSEIKGKNPVFVEDNKNQKIELLEVKSNNPTDNSYYLKVTSDGKRLKEDSINQLFVKRFEEGLEIISKGIASKHGIKLYDKVNQRLGRLIQKYPSVYKMYKIELEKDDNEVCTSIKWERIADKVEETKKEHGVYFIRSSIVEEFEVLIWIIYNCIREIESSFRCLKTDLDLRPIYHKTEDACNAHLHLGLLAYWVVNTIRYQLKLSGIRSDWREIVRIMSTQKCVTTTMHNNKDEEISIRTCSQPNDKVRNIYAVLKMKEAPFVRKKSVVRRYENKVAYNLDNKINTS